MVAGPIQELNIDPACPHRVRVVDSDGNYKFEDTHAGKEGIHWPTHVRVTAFTQDSWACVQSVLDLGVPGHHFISEHRQGSFPAPDPEFGSVVHIFHLCCGVGGGALGFAQEGARISMLADKLPECRRRVLQRLAGDCSGIVFGEIASIPCLPEGSAGLVDFPCHDISTNRARPLPG